MNLASLLFDMARRLLDQPAVGDDYHAWDDGEFAQRVARMPGRTISMTESEDDR
jgi:hypothetical protein